MPFPSINIEPVWQCDSRYSSMCDMLADAPCLGGGLMTAGNASYLCQKSGLQTVKSG